MLVGLELDWNVIDIDLLVGVDYNLMVSNTWWGNKEVVLNSSIKLCIHHVIDGPTGIKLVWVLEVYKEVVELISLAGVLV